MMPALGSIDAVKRAVASFFNVTVAALDGRDRRQQVARPRQVAMYLAVKMTRHSSTEVGRRFGGRDHTTVLAAIKRVEALIEHDPDLGANIEELQQLVPEFAMIPKQLPASIDDAMQLVVLNVVRTAKQDAEAGCIGRPAMIRGALLQLYGERLFAEAACLDGSRLQMLLSPSGTWTILHVADERARISASGHDYTPVVPDEGHAEPHYNDEPVDGTPAVSEQKTRNCNRCGHEFVSPHWGKRRCDRCDEAVRREGAGMAEAV